MKNIGSSFYDELVAYGGLVGEHFTWSPDGNIEFFEDTPESVTLGVKAVYEAHDPDRLSFAETAGKVSSLQAAAIAATAGMANAFIAGLLNEHDTEKFKAWAAYQLALTKISDQPGYPSAIEWPVAPA